MTSTTERIDGDEVAAVARITGQPAVPAALAYEIEQFLYHEARLLDGRRFREWAALLADDIHYWLPVRTNQPFTAGGDDATKPGELAFFDDDRAAIALRIARIESGKAWTEDPPPRVRRIIGNVWARPTDVAGEYAVESNFSVYYNRWDRQVDTWYGSRSDLLRRSGPGEWMIARRSILLEQAVIVSRNLAVFF